MVRLSLREDGKLEGEIIWADAFFIKIRTVDDRIEVLAPKHQILSIEALEGTESEHAEDVMTDLWFRRQPELA